MQYSFANLSMIRLIFICFLALLASGCSQQSEESKCNSNSIDQPDLVLLVHGEWFMTLTAPSESPLLAVYTNGTAIFRTFSEGKGGWYKTKIDGALLANLTDTLTAYAIAQSGFSALNPYDEFDDGVRCTIWANGAPIDFLLSGLMIESVSYRDGVLTLNTDHPVSPCSIELLCSVLIREVIGSAHASPYSPTISSDKCVLLPGESSCSGRPHIYWDSYCNSCFLIQQSLDGHVILQALSRQNGSDSSYMSKMFSDIISESLPDGFHYYTITTDVRTDLKIDFGEALKPAEPVD